MEETILRVKSLIAKREEIDAELAAIFGGTAPKNRKPQACSRCGSHEHTIRTCPQPAEN